MIFMGFFGLFEGFAVGVGKLGIAWVVLGARGGWVFGLWLGWWPVVGWCRIIF